MSEVLFFLVELFILVIAKEPRDKRQASGSVNLSSGNGPPTVLRAAIILTNGSGLAYDYMVVAPALEAAYERSLKEYNIKFEPVLCLYGDSCSQVRAMGATYSAIQENVDMVIGPGCTDDMMASLELQTYASLPSITGAGDLVDSTAKFPYLTRCSYNTLTQWIFVVHMCKRFGWTNVAVIFDKGVEKIAINAASLDLNLRTNDFRPFMLPFTNSSLRGTSETQCLLQNASRYSRVIVLLMDGLLVRRFMIGAKRLGKTNGDYVFFSLDLFRDDILGKNGWKQGDKYDVEAFQAYKTMLILSLRDTQTESTYANFTAEVGNVTQRMFPGSKTTLNYIHYVASFYDSVQLYARAIRELLNTGVSVEKDNVKQVSQRFWNKTFPGATGMVYINPEGDRNDDHAMYDMGDDGVFRVAAEYFGFKQILDANYKFDPPKRPFTWNNPTNTAPANEPYCGYDGTNARCDTTKQRYGIGFGVTLSVVLTGLAVYYRIRRAAKRRSEIQQLDLVGSWTDAETPHYIAPKAAIYRFRNIGLLNGNVAVSPPYPSLEAGSLKGDLTPMVWHAIGTTYKGSKALVQICEVHAVLVSRAVLKEIKSARAINNANVLPLMGLVLGPPRAGVFYEYCAKGSLFDLLGNMSVKLEPIFRFSIMQDIVNGLIAIQNALGCHGRLTSKCCYIDGHFSCRVADYGLPSFFTRIEPTHPDSNYCASLLWTAPERLSNPFGPGSPEADVYSFGIILQEIATRELPFGNAAAVTPTVIIAKLSRRIGRDYHPKVTGNANTTPEVLVLMKQCWSRNPMERPRLQQIRRMLSDVGRSHMGGHGTLVDKLIQQMENYAQGLEQTVNEKAGQFLEEKEKSERLLYQILPRSVAEQLKRGEKVAPESFDSITCQYNDIVSFTTLSSSSKPTEVVDLLNDLFSVFDSVIQKYDAYKVETIGDCYVVASGVPVRNGTQHSAQICRMALNLLEEIKVFKIRHRPDETLRLRLGIHSGPCVSGVVGLVMPRYCLFGETIMITAKMESTSQPMRIQISEFCHAYLQDIGSFETELRDQKIRISDTKELATYWLTGERNVAG